jgi:hypothetical protein
MNEEQKIPEGKVLTADGQLIDRVKACYLLREHPKTKNILFDSKGNQYVKDKNGTLRRFPQKQKKGKER